MKKSLLFLLAAALCASAVPARAAQTGLTLKAGGFVQANAYAPASGGNFAAGLEYEVVHPTGVTPLSVSLYGDVFAKNTGIGFSVRSDTPVYLGAGVGLYHVSFTPQGGGPAFICFNCFGAPPATTANGSGGKIFGGAAIGHSAAIELGYHFMPKVAQTSATTFSAELALRF